MKTFIATIILTLFSLTAQALPTAQTEHAKVTMVSDAAAITPGKNFHVAFDFELEDGWHIYWINPGDSGLATSVFWEIPAGFAISDMQWPAPQRIEVEGLMNYGYEGKVSLLQKLIPPSGLEGEEFTLEGNEVILSAKLEWLVCKEICIPESAEVSLTLPVSDKPLFDEAKLNSRFAALPNTLEGEAYFEDKDKYIYLQIPKQLASDAYFYPYVEGEISNSASQEVIQGDSYTVLKLEKGSDSDDAIDNLRGVLVSSSDSFYINAGAGQFIVPEVASKPTEDMSIIIALLFAVIGGVLLNAMPCVFPILSLKALSISRKAGAELSEVRKQGLSYLAGVLISFLVLAALMLFLKSTGHTLGWGFQLQEPVFITLMLMLFFALGLSLVGMFELPVIMGNSAHKAGQKNNVKGSFLTGVLAVLVATPCAVPFMAPAVGYAFSQPATITLLIMLALGFGLALPYLLLSWFPAIHRKLPKPGAWMNTFKEFMAFPMFATSAWLLWVLAQQISLDDLAVVLFALVGLAFLIWIGKLWSHLLITALLAFTVLTVHSSNAPDSVDVYKELSEPFSLRRLNELRAQNKPVFVNATAAWCITCKVNERVALRDERIAQTFKEQGITYLMADWTNKSDDITKWLARYGRSGVPLYVYYPVNGDEEVVLPQLLTVSTVLDIVKAE